MNPTAFPEVNSLVAEIADRAQLELGDNLLALYLYGSATTGGFNPDLSDVDLLAVTKVDIDQATAAALERMHDDLAASHPTWHDRIEVQYVSAAALADFRRRESWIGAISPGEPFHLKEAGGDWMQNWFDVQQNGVALLGPPPSTFIPHISREEFVQAVRRYATSVAGRSSARPRHRGAEAYDVLTMCRALYSVQTGEQITKEDAARWVAEQFPEWAPAAEQAVEIRRDFRSSHLPCDPKTLEAMRSLVKAIGEELQARRTAG